MEGGDGEETGLNDDSEEAPLSNGEGAGEAGSDSDRDSRWLSSGSISRECA
jgi:hypothetical protein